MKFSFKEKNPLQYAAIEQEKFNRTMKEFGKETKTTFFGDFSIAEWFGVNNVKETYLRCFNEWKNNVEYFTELVMVLNHKIFEWYIREEQYNIDKDFSVLYDELWGKADEYACENFKDEDLSYFYEMTD